MDAQHRFFVVNGVMCRSETPDGSFVPEAVFSAIGGTEVPLEASDDASIARRRSTKRARADPSLAWAGGTHDILTEEASVMRELRHGSGDNLVCNYFEMPCSSVLVDYAGRTAVATADSRVFYPCLLGAPNHRDHSKQMKHFIRGDVDKICAEGWLGVCASTAGTTMGSADSAHRSSARDLARALPGKPLSGLQCLSDETCAELVECTHELNIISHRSIDAAAACATLLRETSLAERHRGHNVALRCIAGDAPDAVAQCRALGSFTCLLPAREGEMCTLTAPRKYRKAALAGKGVRALTEPYHRSNSETSVPLPRASVDLKTFWANIHLLGVGKRRRGGVAAEGFGHHHAQAPPRGSVAAQVRRLSEEYTYFLYGTVGEPPHEPSAVVAATTLTYADGVVAYNELMATRETRQVLVARLAACVGSAAPILSALPSATNTVEDQIDTTRTTRISSGCGPQAGSVSVV